LRSANTVLAVPTGAAEQSLPPRPATGHRHLWIASVLAGVGLVLAVAEVAIFVSGPPLAHNADRALVELVEYVVQGPTLLIGGLIALARRGRNSALGWLLLVPGAVFMLAACLSTWLRFATVVTPGVRAAVYAEFALWQVPRLGLLMFPLCFPYARVPGGWARRFGLLMAAAVGLYELATLLALPRWQPGSTTMPNALYVPAAEPLVYTVRPAVQVILAAGVLALAVSPVVHWRGADEARRRLIAVIVPMFVFRGGEEILRAVTDWSSWVVAAKVAAAVVGPVAMVYSVVRGRLYEVERSARRVIGVAVPLVLLIAVYLVAAATLAVLLPGRSVAVPAVLAVLAALAGLGLRPATRWVQVRLDRLVYGERAEPYELARRLADSLRDGADAATVPLAVCQIVVSALGLPGAALTAGVGEASRLLAAVGVTDGLASIGLRHQGRLVGHLRVAPRPGAKEMDESDRSALLALADLAAPVVSEFLLAEQVKVSQARVHSVREHERSSLERHVYHGVRPLLDTIRLQLGTATALLPPSSPSGQLLARVSAELGEAVAEFGRVTENLRPPVLDELGLPGALAALADRLSTPDLPIRHDLADVPAVCPAVELAAYRIAAEALTNAIRHAAASRVELSLAVRDDTVVLRVGDDGIGLSAGGRRGVGLASMTQRAADVGGTCTVTGSAGGTTVTARLPLAADAALTDA
jgi:two-component system, NarL family, sensor kinase